MSSVVYMLDPANYTPFYNLPLCYELNKLGLRVELLTSRSVYGDYSTYSKDDELQSHIFHRLATRTGSQGILRKLLCGAEHPLDWFTVMRKIRGAMRPLILHSQWLPLPLVDLHFVRRIKAMGIPIVHTVHNAKPYVESHGKVADFKAIYGLADFLIVHTQATADGLMKEFLVPQERIHKITMGGIGSDFTPIEKSVARRKLGLNADEKVILFFGSLRREKGIGALLSIFPGIIRRCPDVKLLIVGKPEGISAAEIRTKISKLMIPDERILLRLEFVPDGEVPVFFGSADLSVFPYEKVDQSGALALSLVLGTPVVVTDVGGLTELVEDRVNGRVAPVHSHKRLADIIVESLGRPEELTEMARRAREKALYEMNWAKVAEQTAAVYERALSLIDSTILKS